MPTIAFNMDRKVLKNLSALKFTESNACKNYLNNNYKKNKDAILMLYVILLSKSL